MIYHGTEAHSRMLQSNVIFQRISEELSLQIFQYLKGEEKEAYKSVLASLAQNRNLRPIFIQKKPIDKQISWMIDNLKLKTSSEIADQALQVWLLKAKKDMLIGFLDQLGIEHDGEGSVEGDLPEKLDKNKLKKAVDEMLESHAEEEVKIYLYLFQSQRSGGWNELNELIDSDERLSF